MNLRIGNLFLVIISLFCASSLYGQSAIITGTVGDAFGHLPGARVAIEGTTLFTSTDVNGNFRMEVDPGEYKLVTTFVMYST
jgi:iron complex outermembrane receptor protein